jgi:SP family sugar:H+ symporter-like MFS transporter
MDDFRYQFGDIRDGPDGPRLSELRTALIVSLLSIGTLFGALIAGPLANKDKIGRKYSICIWSAVLGVGNIFQVASAYPN